MGVAWIPEHGCKDEREKVHIGMEGQIQGWRREGHGECMIAGWERVTNWG